MKKIFLAAFFLAAALLLTASAVSSISAHEIDSPVGAKHVVLIGYDGFGGNYIHWDELPNLSRFKDNGAWTQKMRSVIPSSSAINWASILMGAPSEIHGFRTWGSRAPDLPSAVLTENGIFPDIFYLTRREVPESSLYCVYTWVGIGFLFDNKVMDDVLHAPSAEEVCSKGLEY
ncbi:MAG: alkaline phosphatase family protein, partial [Thermoguttaceae bacterium]|nr:alkaline phosphatase family protein [Thermoguttaceae bacterium]